MGFARTCVGRACDCVASSHFQKKRHFKYVLTPFKISENMKEFSARNFTEMLCASYEVIIVASGTVTYTESGTPMLNWDSRYLCHFSTKMAEIWSPGTSFQDVWPYKISALYLFYFQSY